MSLNAKFLTGMTLILLASLTCLGMGILSGQNILESVNIVEQSSFPALDKASQLTEKVRQTNNAILSAIDGDEHFENEVLKIQREFYTTMNAIHSDKDPKLEQIEMMYEHYVETGIQFGNNALMNREEFDKDLASISQKSRDLTKMIEDYLNQKKKEFNSSMSNIVNNVNNFSTLFPFVAGFLILIVIGLAMLVRMTLKALQELKSHAEKLKEGQLETPVHINRDDEIGVLQQSFNGMRLSLKDLIENLDQKVKDRTRKLHASEREVDNILSSMEQGIFTFNLDMKAGSKHSKNAEKLFGRTEFNDVPVPEIFQMNTEDQASFDKWLKLMQRDSSIERWKKYEQLNPVQKMVLDDSKGKRILKLSYQPILKNEKLNKIMVLASDITEQVRIEKKLKLHQAEKELHLERVLAWVGNNFDDFQNYIINLQRVNDELQNLQLDISQKHDDLFRQLHTHKGNCATYGLNTLSSLIHELEDSLIKFKDEELIAPHTWKKQIDAFDNEFKAIQKTRDLLFKWRQGQLAINAIKYRNCLENIKNKKLIDVSKIYREVFLLNSDEFGFYCHRYQNVVNQLSQTLSKTIRPLRVLHPKQVIPREIMKVFDDALIHILRNAIDHGIEPNEVREKKGKGPGQIELSCEVNNDHYIIRVKDDGEGIPIDRLIDQALSKGYLKENDLQTIDERNKLQFIFKPGFTSKSHVSNISGRGIGLDAAKKNIEHYHGHVTVASHADQGTVFELSLPEKSFIMLDE